ncbi:MAG: protein translocase subunit SecF [Gammaproteobacteria bacterium]|nr:protein translocase subunit SecF [Gammaproteobacteria bacterium]
MKTMLVFSGVDFMGKKRAALVLSLMLLAVSVGSLFTKGLEFGIDFTGGVLIEVGYQNAADLPRIRSVLVSAGFGSAQLQNFGNSRAVLIRLLPQEGAASSDAVGEQILQVLSTQDPAVTLRRVEFVGPQVGEELREQGGLAMLFALLFIMAYVAFRFQWKFSVGAVAALVHDVIIVVGFFSVFGRPFDLAVLAAVLAVIGYSLNDTIVVFDRIRENFLRIRKSHALEVMNVSINQTLSRTLITSMTTLLVLLALFFLGGEAIHSFALALIVGVVIGTYSSIYVASSLALVLDVSTQDLMPPVIDKELDEMP